MAPTLSDPEEFGRESIDRIRVQLRSTAGELGSLGLELLARHGYTPELDGRAPHDNVLSQPLFLVPFWVDRATRESGLTDPGDLLTICESSICGYLSVRAEDDFFDESVGTPEAVMMLSSALRTRHAALLAGVTGHRGFWTCFEDRWRGYSEAMLFEHSLHSDRTRPYDSESFAKVLGRSQPLELPGQAVLAIKDRWDLNSRVNGVVAHLVRSSQLFDDFVDAPADLEARNHTWMVRRLGGLDGLRTLKRNMLIECDQIVSECVAELELAVAAAGPMASEDLQLWIRAREDSMRSASSRLKAAFFDTSTTE